jgi:hypothetical protein
MNVQDPATICLDHAPRDALQIAGENHQVDAKAIEQFEQLGAVVPCIEMGDVYTSGGCLLERRCVRAVGCDEDHLGEAAKSVEMIEDRLQV